MARSLPRHPYARRVLTLTLALAVLLTGVASPLAAQAIVPVEVVAVEGSPLTGSDGNPVTIDGLAIERPTGVGFDYQISDNALHHIHELVMDTGDTSTDGAIYVDGSLVARESLPNGDGDNWDNFDVVSINDPGDYLFSGDTDGDTTTDEFIAYDGAIAIREGDSIGGVVLASGSTWPPSLEGAAVILPRWTQRGSTRIKRGSRREAR